MIVSCHLGHAQPLQYKKRIIYYWNYMELTYYYVQSLKNKYNNMNNF